MLKETSQHLEDYGYFEEYDSAQYNKYKELKGKDFELSITFGDMELLKAMPTIINSIIR